MNLNDIVNTYLEDGYTNRTAISKMCQDIILYKIKKSSCTFDDKKIKEDVIVIKIDPKIEWEAIIDYYIKDKKKV